MVDECIEKWRPVFDGLYEVSNMGRVRRSTPSINTQPGRILSICKSGNGYMIVGLHNQGKRKNCLVHRLVADAFIGKIENGFEVNHLDGDKANNRVENLEIVTRSQNSKHAIAMGLHKPPTERARGDRHWTRLHPDQVARGDRNGAKTKPENTLRGSQCPSSKLTESKVRQIKQLYASGLTKREIASQFAVTYQNINYIVTGQSWKHVQ